MKKIWSIVIAVIAVVAMSVPAVAANIDTSVTVQTGGLGGPPIVKCKWEGPDTGDTGHVIPLTQLLPPVSYGGTVPIRFWAVVTDPEGLLNVANVYVDVYHPAGPPLDGSFKFQAQLLPYENALADGVLTPAEINAAINEVNFAYDAGLITFGEGYDLTEVIEELSQGAAYLWFGEYVMDYHQPCGFYTVEAYAFDAGTNNQSIHLVNQFEYVCVTACEFDFTAINYGTVVVGQEKQVDGNLIWGDGIATVRNIGNTWFHLEVRQDDMGFGITAPSNWNVAFDARLGNALENVKVVYDPAYAKGSPAAGPFTVIPGIVNLCNTWKLDFSIHVEKATQTAYSGLMELQCVYEPFTGPNVPHP